MLYKSLLLLIPFLCCCSKNIYEPLRWQGSDVTIDAEPYDWNIPLRYYDNSTGLNYEVSNDRENLYLAIRITDLFKQQQVLMSGLLIEMDTIRTNNYSYALQFPVQRGTRSGMGLGQPNGSPRGGYVPDNDRIPGEMDKSVHPAGMYPGQHDFPNEFMIRGFNNLFDEEIFVNPSESNGINISMSIDNNSVLFCEAVFPFKCFYKNQLLQSDTTRVLYIKISFKNSPSASMNKKVTAPGYTSGRRDDLPGGGGPPMGGGMDGPGGGMGGPPGGMKRETNMPGDRNLDKNNYIRFACRLSYHDEKK
jgi:hypothetical protein